MFYPGGLAQLLLELKGKIKALGSVNVDAIEEYKKSGVIFNRTRNTFDADSVADIPDVLSVIGEDENQAENDMQGESVFNLSSKSPLYRGAKKALFSLLEEN